MSKIWNFIKTVAKAIWYAFLNILVPGIAILLFIFGFQYDVHCGVESFNWGAVAIFLVAWLILMYWAGNYYRFNKLEKTKKVKIVSDKFNNRIVIFSDKYIGDIYEIEFEEYDKNTDNTKEIKTEFFRTFNN